MRRRRTGRKAATGAISAVPLRRRSAQPYHRRIARSLLKEPKLYLYDFTRVEDEAARFENMVALELNRAAVLWSDYGWGGFKLRYLRTKEKREVDFLLTRDGKPFLMVDRPGIARLIKNGANRVLIASAANWLAGLG